MVHDNVRVTDDGRWVVKAFRDKEEEYNTAAGLGALLLADEGGSAPRLEFVGPKDARIRTEPCYELGKSGLAAFDAADVRDGTPMPNTEEWPIVNEFGKRVVPPMVVVLPIRVEGSVVVSERMKPCTELKRTGDDTAKVILWLHSLAKRLAGHNVHLTDLKADNVIVNKRGRPYLIDWDQVVYFEPRGDSNPKPRCCTSFFNYVHWLMSDAGTMDAFVEMLRTDPPTDDGATNVVNVFSFVYNAGLYSVIDEEPCAKAYLPLEALTKANIAMCVQPAPQPAFGAHASAAAGTRTCGTSRRTLWRRCLPDPT